MTVEIFRESIRVGDHNTETEIDCVEGKCIDPYQRFAIEKQIVYNNFHVDGQNRSIYDIALLRTDRDITYSPTVAPICLGDVITSLKPLKPGSMLSVAGWGHTGLRKPVFYI